MTINLADNTPRVSYAVAEGVTQTSFTVSFEFFDDADLNVYIDGTLKTLVTDYTVTGGDGSTGSITMSVTGASGGSTVVITRDIDLKRTTDFPASGAFQVGSLNTELDKLVAIAADLDDKASRALQLTDYDTAVSLVLPDVDTRKGTVLAFDSTTGAVTAGPASTNVNTLADVADDIATLADIEDGTDATDAIQTVAGISANVTTVAGVSSDVTTVAGQTTNMQNITDNLAAVQNAATNATNAAASATAAAASETAAATSETNAATSATNSATSATSSATSATASAASATAAAASETAAAASETAAAASESAASTSETNAASSASSASTSATNAATSASNASTSESNAATSATAAATSASAAAVSQTAAATSAAAAAAAFDNFDDTYLGSKTADPTVDNDSDPLTQGDLYFNSTANEMRVYDGANWIPASSAGGVSLILYEYTATSGQTTFSGADDNAATLSYTAENIQVFMNGVNLDPSDYTATDGTSVVLATGATTGDLVNIYAFKSFTVADTVSASAGGTFNGNVNFGDNVKAQFGAGNDLQIYHDGSNSYISEQATGNLNVLGTSIEFLNSAANKYYLAMTDGGSLTAYHNGGAKLSTTATGIDVTGELEISGSGEMLRLQSTDTNKAHIVGRGASADRWLLGTVASNDSVTLQATSATGELLFKTGGTNERMRIESGGKVLAGKTSSGYTTDGVMLSNAGNNYSRTSGTVIDVNRNGSNGNAIVFYKVGTAVGSITVTGSSTAFNTSSDHRLKEAVVDMTGAIDRVKALAPKRFNFISDADRTVDGFLAHEAQAIVPEAVTGTHNEVDDDGNPVMQGIDQSKLVPLLTGALREAIAKIEALETSNADLTARIEALETAS